MCNRNDYDQSGWQLLKDHSIRETSEAYPMEGFELNWERCWILANPFNRSMKGFFEAFS
jgi:hypothetical protein